MCPTPNDVGGGGGGRGGGGLSPAAAAAAAAAARATAAGSVVLDLVRARRAAAMAGVAWQARPEAPVEDVLRCICR